LGGNIERMGYSNVIITCASPQLLAKNLPQMFDYVFVDAPCGGEGMFRKDPDTINEWKQERLASNAERQKQIVAEADKMLKPGGKLIYSTCTFSPVEDEDVAMWLAENLGYKFCQIPESIKTATTSFSSEFCRRYYPYLGAGEGQFICVLQKQNANNLEQNVRPQKPINLSKNEQKIVNDWFLGNFCVDFAVNYTKVGEYICKTNQKLQNMLKFMQKVPQINAGIRLGSIEKGRFVPHNNVFVAMGDFAKNKFNFALGDPSIAKYLHGEELPNTGKTIAGYGVVCVDGYPLGGVRISGSALKNLLPKGLRI
jgi:NOL1/NOP2/fmu family ribosome biogenesis protein